jgi:hypothetical protein
MCLTTACENEDEVKIDRAVLVGVWERTHTARAEQDGFASVEEANNWLAAFDWESAKEAIDEDESSEAVFVDIRKDDHAVFYYKSHVGVKCEYRLEGTDIFFSWGEEWVEELFRITSLSETSLVLEVVDEYMVYEDPKKKGTMCVFVEREFYQKRAGGVPDEESYYVEGEDAEDPRKDYIVGIWECTYVGSRGWGASFPNDFFSKFTEDWDALKVATYNPETGGSFWIVEYKRDKTGIHYRGNYSSDKDYILSETHKVTYEGNTISPSTDAIMVVISEKEDWMGNGWGEWETSYAMDTNYNLLYNIMPGRSKNRTFTRYYFERREVLPDFK